jgi:predicted dehydrogenase
LCLGHNMRYFESVLTMKAIIDSGQIGEIQAAWCRHFICYGGDAYFKDWHAEQKYGTGLLLQKGAHDIDVIHWLAGGYTKRVVGMGQLSVYDKCEKRGEDEPGDASFRRENWPPLAQKGMNPLMDVEDHTMIMMQLDNGVQASYLQCHYTPDAIRNYTFIGTKGRVENIGDSGDCQVVLHNQRKGDGREPDVVHNLSRGMGGHGGADPLIVQAFIDFVRDDVPLNTSPVAARYAVAAGCMGTESVRDGSTPREIPLLDQELVDYFERGQKRE